MTRSVRARALAACGALALWLATAAPVATAMPPEASNPVLAYYYTWFDPDSFAGTLWQPDEWYNSDEEGVMRRHVQQAQAAGVDGFIVSWLGNDNRTDVNFGRLLDIGEQMGFHSTIHFDTTQLAPGGPDAVVAQLRAFYERRAHHPAMVHYQGRPVIFFWGVQSFDNGTWDYIRSAVDPEHIGVWIADGDRFAVMAGSAWDGVSPYAIAWSANPASQLPRWGTTARGIAPDKLWIPVVSPGCDDSRTRPTTCMQDRAGGSYYQATWDGALASAPSWAVVVSTFNEWKESTQIEPSPSYGDHYLAITRQNSDYFKALAQQADGG
jgi:hypothetical protein